MDAAILTLTVVDEFDAAPADVWDVWEDPRKLERWWGPPTLPATFTRHDSVGMDVSEDVRQARMVTPWWPLSA